MKNTLPELLSITNFIDKKPKIRFFDGIEGIKEIFLDVLKYSGQPVWAWVTDEVFPDYFDKEFIEYYIPKRVESKVMAYIIAPDTPKIKTYKATDIKSLRQTRIEEMGSATISWPPHLSQSLFKSKFFDCFLHPIDTSKWIAFSYRAFNNFFFFNILTLIY